MRKSKRAYWWNRAAGPILMTFALPVVFIGYLVASAGSDQLALPAAVQPGKLWLIKQNDLAAIGRQYAPDFTYIACGAATQTGRYGVPGGQCHRGQTETFANYWRLKSAIAEGRIKAGQTILFDQEDWKFTPARESADPTRYAVLIGKLCQAAGVRLIFTGVVKGIVPELAVYEAAAPYAYAIGVQTQRYKGNPATFRSYAHRAATALRAINPSVKIILGLSPDAGGKPITAARMVDEYKTTYTLADGYWLNVASWAPPKGVGCAVNGCTATARAFLAVRTAGRATLVPVRQQDQEDLPGRHGRWLEMGVRWRFISG